MVTRLISNINVTITNVNVMVVQDSVSVGMTIGSFEVRMHLTIHLNTLSDPNPFYGSLRSPP